MTQVQKLISVFQEGRELTAKQIATQFNIASPSKIVSLIRREHGMPVYLNKRVDTKGRITHKYRMGNPTKAVVAAGYKALSLGF